MEFLTRALMWEEKIRKKAWKKETELSFVVDKYCPRKHKRIYKLIIRINKKV